MLTNAFGYDLISTKEENMGILIAARPMNKTPETPDHSNIPRVPQRVQWMRRSDTSTRSKSVASGDDRGIPCGGNTIEKGGPMKKRCSKFGRLSNSGTPRGTFILGDSLWRNVWTKMLDSSRRTMFGMGIDIVGCHAVWKDTLETVTMRP